MGEIKKDATSTTIAPDTAGSVRSPTLAKKNGKPFAGQLRVLVIPAAVFEWLRDVVVTRDVTERSARAQAVHRYGMELDQLQARLNVLYDDRLDGRIALARDVATYDKKAAEIRENQERIRTKITQWQPTALANRLR